MSMSIGNNYSQYYIGTESISQYGAGVSPKKDTIVKYDFSTTDADGKKIMDKMTKEETVQTMKEISAQYGDNVIVEFSGDGLAALIDSRKGKMESDAVHNSAKQAAFDAELVHLDKKANYLPEYSGIVEADKAIASATENNSKEEQAFVYDIIRNNFLVSNSNSLSEEERQANISLGMKKAEYAAKNFIDKDKVNSFLSAMESVAKLAVAGKADENGNMDYGVKKGNYLGHGSNLVYTTDSLDMMRTMDSKAYETYQKINSESSNEDRALNALKYLTNWQTQVSKTNPHMVQKYEEQSEEYLEKNVKQQKINDTFKEMNVDSKEKFLQGLLNFQKKQPDFLKSILANEIDFFSM